MIRYTIICVDVKSSDDEPILVQNYGIMTLKQAKEKLEEIYQDELSNYDKENIIKTDYYIGVSFSDTDLDVREYYLQKVKELIKEENEEYLIHNVCADTYYYTVFVLSNMLRGKLPFEEDDLTYNFCKKVATDFDKSDYNRNTKGLYECLEEYVRNSFVSKDGNLTWNGEIIE